MKLNRISRTFNSETRNKFPMHLQIFADGGDTGADGGNSGVGDGDDGSGGGEGDYYACSLVGWYFLRNQ